METENKDEVEPALITPCELQPSPPSKAASINSGEQSNEKKYETIQTIKMTDTRSTMKLTKPMEKNASAMASSLNLVPTTEANAGQKAGTIRGLSVNTKLGIIQLVLSLLLSAFGGLLIARSSSLAWLCSGVWAGILAGITGSLGLMNMKQLINGFLACSLICVASSTLAITFTCIGLLRDFNMLNSTSQYEEYEAAVLAASGLTFLLVLHLLTSMFSVYYSALELCSKDVSTENMNYEKFQNISLYLKSLQNAGVNNCYDMNGYQNYINDAKLYRQRSLQHSIAHNSHPWGIQPIYAPVSAVSSNYMYTLPHSYQSNFYQDFSYNDRRTSEKNIRKQKDKKPATLDDSSKFSLNYMGEDRDIAENYLKSIEAREAK